MIDYLKSFRWADIMGYVLTDPGAMYRAMKGSEKYSIIAGIPLLLAASLSSTLASSLLARQSGYFTYKISYGLILLFIVSLIWIIISASLMDLFAQFSGLKGNIAGMVSILVYSSLPGSFLLPVTALFAITGFAPVFFYFLSAVMLFIWAAYAAVTGISEMHSIPLGRSALIYFFPYFLFVAGGLFIFLLSIVCLYGYVLSL